MTHRQQIQYDIQKLEDAMAAVANGAFGARSELEAAARVVIDDLREEAGIEPMEFAGHAD